MKSMLKRTIEQIKRIVKEIKNYYENNRKVKIIMTICLLVFLIRPIFQMICEDELLRCYLIQQDYYSRETTILLAGKGHSGIFLPGITQIDYILKILQCIFGTLFFVTGFCKTIFAIKKSNIGSASAENADNEVFYERKRNIKKQGLCAAMYICGLLFMIRPIYHCIYAHELVREGLGTSAYLGHVGEFEWEDINHITLLRPRLLYTDFRLEIMQYIVLLIFLGLAMYLLRMRRKEQNKSKVKKLFHRRQIAVIVIVFILGGIIFSNRTGYYYPILGKSHKSDYYVIGEEKNECQVLWESGNYGMGRLPEIDFCKLEYRRYGNVVIMNSGKYICVGFWNLSIMIEPDSGEEEYIALFYGRNSRKIIL